jgi:aspartate dehydrogenase
MLAAADGAFKATIAGVNSRDEARARAFLDTLAPAPPYLSVPELVERADLIVEAAGGHVVPELAALAFAAGKDLLVISVGALLDHPEVMQRARETGCRLIVPSGAIAGLDGIKSASMGRLEYVRLTSRKPPRALAGAPFLVERGLDLTGLAEPRELFRGYAREAVRAFPDNLNISAALSLAGIGPDRTDVRVVADPALSRNCHDIECAGEFGLLRVHIENVPSENPRTGRLTALSIIRALRDAVDPVRLGS